MHSNRAGNQGHLWHLRVYFYLANQWQVIPNPSFYGDVGGGNYGVKLDPWVITHVSGSPPGCALGSGYSAADNDQYYGDPGYV